MYWSIYVFGIKGLFTKLIAFGTNSMLFIVICESAISLTLLWQTFKGKGGVGEFLELITLYAIFVHIFRPRGIY